MKRFLLICCLSLVTASVLAVSSDEPLEDPELQARFDRFTNELRCLVCQNQTVADSAAGLAQDLRDETRRLLLEGATDEEIVTFMTDRYGDFVLYRPPLSPKTYLLWSAPVLFLLLGIFLAGRVIVQRSKAGDLPIEGEEPFDVAATAERDGGHRS